MHALNASFRLHLSSTALPAVLAGVVLVCGLAVPGTARADDVILLDGTKCSGEVIELDDKFVVLESGLGRLRIPRSAVREIRRDAPPSSGSTEPGKGAEPAGEPAPLPPTRTPREAEGAAAAAREEADRETADRIRRMQRSRIVRRTNANAEPEPAEPATVRPGGAASATVGGRFLAQVAKGTPIIVFQPPRPFEAAPGSIEIGRRLFARMVMAGSASAFVARPGADGEVRVPLRLANVKRHLEVTSDASRVRIFEGINGGDWLRVRTEDGRVLQGRFKGLADGAARLTSFDELGTETTHLVPANEIVEVDGLIRDTASQIGLLDLEQGEPLAITFWPDGRQALGRYVRGSTGTISLDVDGDGEIDRNVARDGPLAEIRRIPMRYRTAAVSLKLGAVVRATLRETFPAGLVRRTVVGPVEAVTAFALAVDVGDGSAILPFDGLTDLIVIENDPGDEVRAFRAVLPRDTFATDLPILPGTPVADAPPLDERAGVSAINDGRQITHVFASAPYATDVFGVRIGEPVSHSLRRSPLRFDTMIVRRAKPGEPRPPQEHISETVEGLRVIILTDGVGSVTAVEIGLRD